jgi:hypothetical protein
MNIVEILYSCMKIEQQNLFKLFLEGEKEDKRERRRGCI